MNYSVKSLDSFGIMFARLQRRASKLGLPVPSFRVIGERCERVQIHSISEGQIVDTGEADVIVHDLEIDGIEPVKLPGWNFAARLETVNGGENLVYGVPGVEIPSRFSSSGCVCEHCRLNRQRKDTFVVRHAESGEWKQVGSTCLADFVGGDGAEALANIFAFYGQIFVDLDAFAQGERDGWEGGRAAAAYNLRDLLARSIYFADKFGWMSRTKAAESYTPVVSTADRVLLSYKERLEIPESMYEQAETAIAYFAGLPESALVDTLTRNARIVANAGFCSAKSFGLGCALWVCYQVALTRAEGEAKREWQRQNGKHVFEVGKRVKGITATIARVFTFETQWGVSVKSILHDDEGNVLVAKDVGEQGQRVRFTATVKEHSEWNGIKQTVLLRAANVEVL